MSRDVNTNNNNRNCNITTTTTTTTTTNNNNNSVGIYFKKLGGLFLILAITGCILKNEILKILFGQLDIKITKPWC